ncbi:hypothetical protein [Phocaeicola sp.]
MTIFETLDKESTSKSEVYLYEEEGKWYAYDRSATLLKRFGDGIVKLTKRASSIYGVMREKVEVDLNQLLNSKWFVALCSDTEIMLIKND